MQNVLLACCGLCVTGGTTPAICLAGKPNHIVGGSAQNTLGRISRYAVGVFRAFDVECGIVPLDVGQSRVGTAVTNADRVVEKVYLRERIRYGTAADDCVQVHKLVGIAAAIKSVAHCVECFGHTLGSGAVVATTCGERDLLEVEILTEDLSYWFPFDGYIKGVIGPTLERQALAIVYPVVSQVADERLPFTDRLVKKDDFFNVRYFLAGNRKFYSFLVAKFILRSGMREPRANS